MTVIGGTNEKYGNSEGKFSIEVNKSKWDSADIESELNKILKKFKNFQVNVRKGGDELKTIRLMLVEILLENLMNLWKI